MTGGSNEGGGQQIRRHRRWGAANALLVFLLLLSGTLQVDATYDGFLAEEGLHPIGDEFADPAGVVLPSNDGSVSSEDEQQHRPSSSSGAGTGHASSVRRQLLLLNSPTDRLGFCNESTVAHLTATHFQILENGLREYRCWTPRLGRLMTMLRQELSRGGGGSSSGYGSRRQQQSANEGSRLRCRILFKYDTCRSNFAKYRSMDNPEISIEWPDEILNVINNTL